MQECFVPPAAFIRLSASLHVLTLTAARSISTKFPVDDVEGLHFPHLRQLTIDRFHSLLSKCPVLESLVLSQSDDFRCLRISSPTLRSFGVSDDLVAGWALQRLKQVIVEDAPLLEMVFIRHWEYRDGISVRISGAPRLEFLGSLTYSITTLELGTTVFKENVPVKLTTAVRTVKILVVHMSPPNIDDVIGLMKCFPCLQKLYILISQRKRPKRVQHHNPLDYLECFDLHPKELVLVNYQGEKGVVEFAKFFLLNARVLEMVELANHRQKCVSKFLAKQRRKLRLKNRASQDAKAVMSCYAYSNDLSHSYSNDTLHISHMHDMRIHDPFDRSLCSCKRFQFL
ncbi:hypothetical protein U9M48_012430 [Paspalum notatum var. saurae]|uniref:FBD domain-containing protein n=1 Tax=Paspalum notatum var. saurae TaxID=547442 RepID=A0AAQ3SY97_PASNO